MALKTHGITTETIKNLLLNACTVYKNLKYTDGAWSGTVIGATSGGTKFNWEYKWLDVEVDGATVLVKGLSKQKVGESAHIEGQMTELTEGIFIDALHLVEDTSASVAGYKVYTSPSNITEDDYLENISLVGTLSSGKQIIIILPNAICTEAFEIESKNAEQTTFSVKFEATADMANDNLNKLDVQIYYPQGE